MSVVIKGIIMPKNCAYCRFCIEEDEMFETVYRCDITGEYINDDYDGVYPDNCPIVDLGKHGDLIDADELKKEFPKDTDWEYPVNTNEYVCEMIDNAKTVIEAEDE